MPSIRLASITIAAALFTALSATAIAQEPPPERESLENAFKGGFVLTLRQSKLSFPGVLGRYPSSYLDLYGRRSHRKPIRA